MAEDENTVKKAASKKAATKKAAPKKAAPKKAAAAAAPAEKAAEAPAAPKLAAPKPAAPKPAAPKKAAAPKTESGVKMVKLTLVRSKYGRLKSHQACIAGLGLRRMHQTVQVIDTPENRGMINKVQYMLKIEEA